MNTLERDTTSAVVKPYGDITRALDEARGLAKEEERV